MVDDGQGIPDFSTLIQFVCGRIREQLEPQIAKAGREFRSALVGLLPAIITEAATDLKATGFRHEQVDRVVTAIRSEIVHTTEELVAWFSSGANTQTQSMSISEIRAAVEGVYEQEISGGALSIGGISGESGLLMLPIEQTRLFFDLLDEVVANALKHSNLRITRVRASIVKQRDKRALRLSSTADTGEPRTWSVIGRQYRTASDTIFGERGSGLPKIAALAATLNNREVSIEIVRKSRAFHLIVPLEPVL
jgi:hypothetical protein